MLRPPFSRALLAVASMLPGVAAHAADYTLDAVHTQVFACASHLGLSEPCARFRIKSGFVHFDGDWSAATVDAVVDTASLDLGDAKWNGAVRSWQFLDADKYPQAHFISQSVEKTGEKSGLVHGTLTLRGVTRGVDLQVTFNRAGLDPYDLRYTAGFSATATLKRSNFGMTKYLPDIGDAVTIRIQVEGLRGKTPPVQTAPAEPGN